MVHGDWSIFLFLHSGIFSWLLVGSSDDKAMISEDDLTILADDWVYRYQNMHATEQTVGGIVYLFRGYVSGFRASEARMSLHYEARLKHRDQQIAEHSATITLLERQIATMKDHIGLYRETLEAIKLVNGKPGTVG